MASRDHATTHGSKSDQEKVACLLLLAATPGDDAAHSLEPESQDQSLRKLLQAVTPRGRFVNLSHLEDGGRVCDPRVTGEGRDEVDHLQRMLGMRPRVAEAAAPDEGVCTQGVEEADGHGCAQLLGGAVCNLEHAVRFVV
jgi:hypothetical protein